jgi:hypothetical protein
MICAKPAKGKKPMTKTKKTDNSAVFSSITIRDVAEAYTSAGSAETALVSAQAAATAATVNALALAIGVCIANDCPVDKTKSGNYKNWTKRGNLIGSVAFQTGLKDAGVASAKDAVECAMFLFRKYPSMWSAESVDKIKGILEEKKHTSLSGVRKLIKEANDKAAKKRAGTKPAKPPVEPAKPPVEPAKPPVEPANGETGKNGGNVLNMPQDKRGDPVAFYAGLSAVELENHQFALVSAYAKAKNNEGAAKLVAIVEGGFKRAKNAA